MLYACDQRFDVMENLENFYEVNKASPIERTGPRIDKSQFRNWRRKFDQNYYPSSLLAS